MLCGKKLEDLRRRRHWCLRNPIARNGPGGTACVATSRPSCPPHLVRAEREWGDSFRFIGRLSVVVKLASSLHKLHVYRARSQAHATSVAAVQQITLVMASTRR